MILYIHIEMAFTITKCRRLRFLFKPEIWIKIYSSDYPKIVLAVRHQSFDRGDRTVWNYIWIRCWMWFTQKVRAWVLTEIDVRNYIRECYNSDDRIHQAYDTIFSY